MAETENVSEYKSKLNQQLIEAHGKVMYTYTAHHKMADRIIGLDSVVTRC